MNRVIPGILEKDWLEIEKKLEIVKSFTNTAHIDFIDGKFSSNQTFFEFEKFKKFSNDLNFEAHLMVENPLQYIQSLADAGFRRFIGHIEKMPDVADFVAQGQILGEVGLALDSTTSVEDLKVNFEDLDCILIMGVKAGLSGQMFMTQALDKIISLRRKTIVPIEVDGGIDENTIVQARVAGANRFVSTSFLFNSPNPQESFEKLTELVLPME